MKDGEPCEIVIRYQKRWMPPTSLFFLKRRLEQIGESFTPKLKVRTEKVTVK